MLNLAKLIRPRLSFTIGDPHFHGFDGESFDFMGEPNRYYNLLTDAEVQVNALFVHWPTGGADNFTATEQIGILVKNHRLQISPTGLTIDGLDVPEAQTTHSVGAGASASVEKFDQLDDRCSSGMRNDPRCANFIRGYRVKTRCGYEFVITVSTDNVNPPFLNLASKMNRRLWPHGIIGQTADHDGMARHGCGQNGEGIIEGRYPDYEVSSLWGTDFKFNKYKTDGGRRSILRRSAERFLFLILAATRKAVDRSRSLALSN